MQSAKLDGEQDLALLKLIKNHQIPESHFPIFEYEIEKSEQIS